MNPAQKNITVTTAGEIPGRQITKILGVVRGNTVRTKHIGKDFLARLKSLVGGEIKGYSKMISQARDEAFSRMIENALELNADAIIEMRFATSGIMQNASEILAYGTAVKLD